MKVLQPQTHPPGSWSAECDCAKCGARLLVDESDLTYHHYSDQREGVSYSYCTAKCPECRGGLRFNGVPQPVMDRVRKRGTLRSDIDTSR